MNRESLFTRIKSVGDEYLAANVAVTQTLSRCDQDPTDLLGTSVQPRDLRTCRDNLMITYVIRLFAVFETALRIYWTEGRRMRRRKWPRMRAELLINNVAALQNIPTDFVSEAHRVREFRNALLHTGFFSTRLALDDCRRRLCRFLSYLPPQW